MKTKTLGEYPGAKEICELVEFYNLHPHQLCRGDGTMSLYGLCRYILMIDHSIFKYGEEYGWTYDRAKALMRRARKIISVTKLEVRL